RRPRSPHLPAAPSGPPPMRSRVRHPVAAPPSAACFSCPAATPPLFTATHYNPFPGFPDPNGGYWSVPLHAAHIPLTLDSYGYTGEDLSLIGTIPTDYSDHLHAIWCHEQMGHALTSSYIPSETIRILCTQAY